MQPIDRISSVFCLLITLLLCSRVTAAEYQWSVPVDPLPERKAGTPPRAFLWVPSTCQRVRAVIVGQQNMLEEDIFDHPEFRKAMSELGVGIIWITPAIDPPFEPEKTGARFQKLLKDLADESGYTELEFAPIVPLGHSAAASYPWNFAAWAPQRTLAVLSVKGDAPETPLAGFGKPNTNWGERNIDGVPGLMVMGEYEWLEARLAPAVVYHVSHPKAPIAVLADIGEGHFNACDDLVRFLAMFVRKCVEQRLPAVDQTPVDKPPLLKSIDPTEGWLVQRWYPGVGRAIDPAPFNQFSGDPVDAFWAFDGEMAQAIQSYHIHQNNRLPQLIGFVQEGKLVAPTPTHPMVNLKFLPEPDDETFSIETKFLDTVTTMGDGNDLVRKNNHMRWTGLPAGSPIGHAVGGGPIQVHRIEGPIEQIGPNHFRLSFYRGFTDRQAIWICATHPGDDQYKSVAQQATMGVPRNDTGTDQSIDFPAIASLRAGVESLHLKATSSAGLPVHYFVREGPASIDGDTLKLLPIPPRAKFPVKVTVVAWQWGRSTGPRVKTAKFVEQTVLIDRAASIGGSNP